MVRKEKTEEEKPKENIIEVPVFITDEILKRMVFDIHHKLPLIEEEIKKGFSKMEELASGD